MRDFYKKRWFIYVIIFIAVFIYLMFRSQSSFLYKMNDWYDTNCYYTVSYAMKHGKILYKDIYEQKGPYLYFIHVIALLIDSKGYFGIFLIEVLYGFLLGIFAYEILSLYFKEVGKKLFLLMIFLTMYYITPSFSHGDSVEESVMPLMIITFYFILKQLKTNNHMKWYEMSLIGFFMGFVLLEKFTLIIPFCIIPFFVFLFDLMDNKPKLAFRQILYFLFGFIVSLIPCIIYFSITKAFDDLWTVYFYNNLFLYSTIRRTHYEKIFLFLKAYFISIKYCWPLYVMSIFPIYVFFKNRLWKERVTCLIIVSFVVTAISIFYGGKSYRYYGLPLMSFGIFSVISLGMIRFSSVKIPFKQFRYYTLLLIYPISVFSVWLGTIHGYAIFKSKEDYPVLVMAELIKNFNDKTKNKAKILNYGFLDCGLYYNSNSVPAKKYFSKLNIDLIQMKEEQDISIKNGDVTFVVTNKPLNMAFANKYVEVYNKASTYDGKECHYYLYQLSSTLSK